MGRIDFLGDCPIGTFDEIAARAVDMDLGGVRCRVMCLDDLIAVKAALGRPKDKIVEMELRAIRDRLRAG
jgi:predicted nucleotidyltransferase